MKISRMINVDLDLYYDKSYLCYKLSNSWINSRLKKNIDSAIYNGTPLYSADKMNKLWCNKRPYCIYDDSVYIDSDYRYYIIKDVYGWGVPCKESIDLISKYAEDRVIFDIGCGTGMMSAMLSHRHKVISLDNKSESFDYEYVDIKRCNVINDDNIYEKEKNPFVILVYPRNSVLFHSFKKAPIGTRFYIHIPFLATNTEFMNIAAQVLFSSEILTFDIKDWFDSKVRLHEGVIIEKVKDFKYDEKFNILKYMLDFTLNDYAIKLDWLEFIKICNTLL